MQLPQSRDCGSLSSAQPFRRNVNKFIDDVASVPGYIPGTGLRSDIHSFRGIQGISGSVSRTHQPTVGLVC